MKILASAHEKFSAGGQFDDNIADNSNCSPAFKAGRDAGRIPKIITEVLR